MAEERASTTGIVVESSRERSMMSDGTNRIKHKSRDASRVQRTGGRLSKRVSAILGSRYYGAAPRMRQPCSAGTNMIAVLGLYLAAQFIRLCYSCPFDKRSVFHVSLHWRDDFLLHTFPAVYRSRGVVPQLFCTALGISNQFACDCSLNAHGLRPGCTA